MKKLLAIILSLSIVISTATFIVTTSAANTTTEAGDLVIDISGIEGCIPGRTYGHTAELLDFTTKGAAYNLGAIDLTQYVAIGITYGAEQFVKFENNVHCALASGAIQDADGNALTATEYANFTLLDPLLSWFYVVNGQTEVLRTMYLNIDSSNYVAGSDVYLSGLIGDNGFAVSSITFYKTAAPCVHSGGSADCMNKAVCDLCGEEYGNFNYGKHIGNEVHSMDGIYCDACGEFITTLEYHYYDTTTDTLYIYGLGDMISYDSAQEYDWYEDAYASVKKVVIDSDITSVSPNAFAGYSTLETVDFGTTESQIMTIGENAFMNCQSLTSIYFGPNLESIGDGAFSLCFSLTDIQVDSGNRHIAVENNVIFDIEKTKLINYVASKTDTSYTVPSTVKEIAAKAFMSCTALTSVTVPASVETIGSLAFAESSIENVTFASDSTLTSIGDSAFLLTPISTITLPDSLTTIGRDAFSLCESLTSIIIPENVTIIDVGTFECCTSLATVSLPNGLLSISNNAFADCYALAEITIPSGVEHFGTNVFPTETVINCYDGSAAEQYAIENSMTYNLLGQSFSSNGVYIEIPTDVTVDSGATFTAEKTTGTISATSEYEQFALTLTDASGTAITSSSLTVKLPLNTSLNASSVKIYSVSTSGTKTEISADISTGYAVFTTSSVGTYRIEYNLAVAGDVNNDGTVDAKDILAFKLHLNGTTATAPSAMDFNGDGVVNTVDLNAIAIYIKDTDLQ